MTSSPTVFFTILTFDLKNTSVSYYTYSFHEVVSQQNIIIFFSKMEYGSIE